MLDVFGEATIGEELFRTLARTLEKGQEYTLFGKLADEQIIYNPDFFERISSDKVRFLGETGVYTLYYNTYRKHMIVGVADPAYPDAKMLPIEGRSPTTVKFIFHSSVSDDQ